MKNSVIFHLLFTLMKHLRCLISESTIFLAFSQICFQFQTLFYNSFCFEMMRNGYHAVRQLCYDSMLGQLLIHHSQEDHLYDDSIICRLFDAFFIRVTIILRKLAFWGDNSIIISFGQKLRHRFQWLDFEFVCGCTILLILLFPGMYWRNMYALILSLILLVLLAIKAAAENRPMLQLRMMGLPFIVFVIATIVSVGTAGNFEESVRVFCFFLTAFLFYIIIIGTLNDEQKLKKLLAFIYIAVVAAAIWAVCQRIIGVEVSVTLTDLAANVGMPGRVYSFYENPNNYAEIIILLLPMAFAYCAAIDDINYRFICLFGLIFPIAALLMTYSRSGWISFALAVVTFVFFYKKKNLPMFILLGFLTVPLLPETIFHRILTIGSMQDSSNMYRVYIWDSVMGIVRDHGLIGLGLGPGNFSPIYQQYSHQIAFFAPHSHMLYLELWLEMGILGIGSYLVYYLTIIRNAVIHMASASKSVRFVLIAGVSSLIGIAFVSAVEYIWFYPRVLFCFFLLTGIITAGINISNQL